MPKAKKIRPHVFLYYVEKEKAPTRLQVNQGWRAEAIIHDDARDLLRSATYQTRDSALRDIKYQLQQLGFKSIAEVFTMEHSEM